MDAGEPVDIVCLDFQKAFDTVPHQRLLGKLYGQEIRRPVLLSIENWLRTRKERVGVNGQIFSRER